MKEREAQRRKEVETYFEVSDQIHQDIPMHLQGYT